MASQGPPTPGCQPVTIAVSVCDFMLLSGARVSPAAGGWTSYRYLLASLAILLLEFRYTPARATWQPKEEEKRAFVATTQQQQWPTHRRVMLMGVEASGAAWAVGQMSFDGKTPALCAVRGTERDREQVSRHSTFCGPDAERGGARTVCAIRMCPGSGKRVDPIRLSSWPDVTNTRPIVGWPIQAPARGSMRAFLCRDSLWSVVRLVHVGK